MISVSGVRTTSGAELLRLIAVSTATGPFSVTVKVATVADPPLKDAVSAVIETSEFTAIGLLTVTDEPAAVTFTVPVADAETSSATGENVA